MYAKIFDSLFTGSMRGKSDEILVWVNMLVNSSGGICDRTTKTIAEETGLPMKRVLAAIKTLESPDTDSRSPDEEGRRIIRLDEHRDWGWKLVNWTYYHNLVSEADRREKAALRQRRHRELKRSLSRSSVTTRDNALCCVTPASASASVSASVQSFGKCENLATPPEAIIPSFDEIKEIASARGIPFPVAKSFFDYYQANNLWLNRHDRPINVGASLTRWASNERQKHYANPKGFNPKNLQKPPPTPGSTPVNGF